jgi:tetratricopeptide (TPR) repeat protein
MNVSAKSRTRRNLPRRLLFLVSCLAGIALFPGARAADDRTEPAPWYVLYQKGVQAMVNDQWGDAASQFEKAIQERQPLPRPSRTYGMWQVDYTPYYNLAVCYFYLGRDPQALQALKRSESAEEIPPDSPMRDKIQRIRRAIQGAPGQAGRERDNNQMAEGLSLLLLPGGSGRAVELLQGLLPGREDDAQIHLFLGLAYARNAAQVGSDNTHFWLDLARTEFRRVRQLNPRLRLAGGFFAPEIESLFKEAAAK